MVDDRNPPAVRDAAGVADLLRTCVQCGLCLPHCATYLGTGSEVQSPRGRLVLLGRWYGDSRTEGAEAFLEAFDQCIGCRACETACPSGVPFSLLERGMDLAAGRPASAATPAVPSVVARRLDRPGFLGVLAGLGRVGRAAARLVAGRRWRSRLERAPAPLAGLARLLGAMPRAPRADEELAALLAGRTGSVPAGAPLDHGDGTRGTVAFFRGCANQGFLPDASRRLCELIAGAGYRIVDPPGQDCCGALAAHTGRPGRAASLAATNEEVFAPHLTADAVLVVEAAGCGHELKKNRRLGPRTRDAVEFLAGAELPPLGRVPLRVALHDPCHARHGQGLVDAPRRLLARIPGLEILEPAEPEVCCGSGGAWGLRYPGLSADLGRRKAGFLAATGADLVVTANPGCLGQIADGLAFADDPPPVVPLTDLVWYAARLGRG